MMKTVMTKTYTQSVDEIAASYLDADFLTSKFEAIGSRNIDVSVVVTDDDEYGVTVKREAPAEVPGALKSVVKSWNKVVQHETWDGEDGGPYQGTIQLETEGVPAEISVVIDLEDNDDGCTCTITTDVECKIPLIGKKLAQFIGKESAKSVDGEYAFIAENA